MSGLVYQGIPVESMSREQLLQMTETVYQRTVQLEQKVNDVLCFQCKAKLVALGY